MLEQMRQSMFQNIIRSKNADKDTISITNNNGHTLSDGSENIICNLTYQQQGKTNVVDWYYIYENYIE